MNKFMNTGLEIINPIEHPGWDQLLLDQPDCSFFHTSHWASVLHDSYGYQPRYFAAVEQGSLKACIPVMEIRSSLTGTRGVSLPFTDYCYPLLPASLPAQEAFDAVIQYGGQAGWQTIEFRGGEKLPLLWPSSSFYYGHKLDLLREEDALFSNLKDSTRRNIRKALREGVSITMSGDSGSMEEFYRLNCITRKAHGLPPQPLYFFKNVRDHVLAKGHGHIALARHKGNAIAGAVYFHFGTRALYKYGASDRRYLHMRPNDLVMWEAIAWYRDRGYDALCFGRTELENEGLRAFKKGWGAEEKIIRYALYDMGAKQFVAGSPADRVVSAAILRRMPVPFLKFIGSALYRHVG